MTRRSWVILALLVLFLGSATWFVFRRTDNATVVRADFAYVNGIYPGSNVTILGVPVGKVTEVVPHDDLLTRAKEIADIVNSNAPLAVRGTRLAIHKTLDLPLLEGEILAETFRERVVRTDDAIEGPLAFVEKRVPNWKCR